MYWDNRYLECRKINLWQGAKAGKLRQVVVKGRGKFYFISIYYLKMILITNFLNA